MRHGGSVKCTGNHIECGASSLNLSSARIGACGFHDGPRLRLRGIIPQKPLILTRQEPALFTGSLRDNITYGSPGVSAERLKEALRVAGCGFVDSLPNGALRGRASAAGLDTVLTERGGSLSGGQKQRIALAR